jgi:tetratricopeptide (TPR) repeat protein
MRAYNESIRLKPDYAQPRFGLGDLYFDNLNRYEDAITAYEGALRLQPNNAVANYRVGWSYNDLNRYSDAIPYLREAVRLKPEYSEAFNELGFALLNIQRYNEAVASFKEATRIKPDYGLAYYNLGITYLSMRDKNRALEQYRILQRIDPQRAAKLYSENNERLEAEARGWKYRVVGFRASRFDETRRSATNAVVLNVDSTSALASSQISSIRYDHRDRHHPVFEKHDTGPGTS